MSKIKLDKRNYRVHSQKNKDLIKKSLTELGAGRSVVIDSEDTLVAGNGVFEQAQKIGMPTKIIETDGSELIVVKRTDLKTDDEKRKKLALADNSISDTSEFDFDVMANDFMIEDLADWGVELPEMDFEDAKKVIEEREDVEELLNKAMVQYISEYTRMVDYCMQADFGGFLPDGRSIGYAKLQYIKAKFYGRKYDGKNSFIFTPKQFFVKSRNNESYYHAMQNINGGLKRGIAGFRTMTNDGNLNLCIGNQYRVVAAAAADFPPMIAFEIFKKYYKGGRVLDPCHGWGGRLVGAMLADVKEYIGVDPSPDAHEGVLKIYEAFKEYQDTKAELIEKPFEDCEWKDGEFDFALTCPPYFDVEKYEGEETSIKRYPQFDLWCEKFYEPLITNTMKALKKDGAFCIVVGSQKYPLAEKLKNICQQNGFCVRKSDMKILSDMHGTDDDLKDNLYIIQYEKAT